MSKTKKLKLGIPYMGSKRKLASPILDHIIESNPKVRYLYDLFGGGGAISFEALQQPQLKEVHYNELNESIVNLLLKIRDDGVTDEFYKWISREEFNELKTGTCWKSGLIKTCWSFGNNQKDYLYGKATEEDKRLMHEIVVNKCEKSLNTFNDKFGLDFKNDGDSMTDRRLQLQSYIKTELKTRVGELQHLERLIHLERFQQLQQLTNLERLKITNLSYEQVNINTPVDETVIYLDPPYKNRKKYEKEIDHNKLEEWIKSSPYKIYISSYEFDGLREVANFNHRSTLSATVNNKVTERLFCNR